MPCLQFFALKNSNSLLHGPIWLWSPVNLKFSMGHTSKRAILNKNGNGEIFGPATARDCLGRNQNGPITDRMWEGSVCVCV